MYFRKIIGPRPLCLMLIKFSAYRVRQSSVFFSFSSIISFKIRINTDELLVGGSVLREGYALFKCFSYIYIYIHVLNWRASPNCTWIIERQDIHGFINYRACAGGPLVAGLASVIIHRLLYPYGIYTSIYG